MSSGARTRRTETRTLAFGEKRDMSGPARPVLRSRSRHRDATHTTGTDRCHLHGTPRCPVPLAGQIFGPLLGEFAFEQAGGLADFDHVAVGVAHVAADLSAAIDRRRHDRSAGAGRTGRGGGSGAAPSGEPQHTLGTPAVPSPSGLIQCVLGCELGLAVVAGDKARLRRL
jgi:hypothetical protein